MTPEDWGRRLARRVLDRNPFLLASALLVLAGGYLVAVTDARRSAHALVALFGFIQLYEFAVLGAAAFIHDKVVARDKLALRDVATLIALEVLFLGDFSFTATVLPGGGATRLQFGIDREDLIAPIGAALVAIALAPLKLHVAGKAARIRWPWSVRIFVLLAVGVIQGGPVLALVAAESSRVSSLVEMFWWAAGLLPLLLVPAIRGDEVVAPFQMVRSKIVAVLGGALVLAACGHAFAAGWTHDVPFQAVFLVPPLLGLGAAAPRLTRSARLTATLVGLGIAVTAMDRDAFAGTARAVTAMDRDAFAGTTFVKSFAGTRWFRLALVAGALALLDGARVLRSRGLLVSGLAAATVAFLGESPGAAVKALATPPLPVTILVTVLAVALTVTRNDHAPASIAGLAAAYCLAGGIQARTFTGFADAWLGASFVALHQLVIAHRKGSPGKLWLRTMFAWAALLLGLASAASRGLSLVDLYVLALALSAIGARACGLDRAHPVPGSLVLVVLGALRVGSVLPSSRGGMGVLALGGGAAFLLAGFVVSIGRQRFRAALGEEKPEEPVPVAVASAGVAPVAPVAEASEEWRTVD